MASRIVHGEGAWAWDPSRVEWAQNEVEVIHASQRLRIDRLVRLCGSGQWWVLDYKTSVQSSANPKLLAQLARYRDAVGDVLNEEKVRAAFLGANGSLAPLP